MLFSKDHMGKSEHSHYFLLSKVKDLTSQLNSLLLPFPFPLFVRMLLYFLVEMLWDSQYQDSNVAMVEMYLIFYCRVAQSSFFGLRKVLKITGTHKSGSRRRGLRNIDTASTIATVLS